MTRNQEDVGEAMNNGLNETGGQEFQMDEAAGHQGKAPVGNQMAEDFRLTLALSEYGFGAMYMSKQLLRSRGMVQSWKRMGECHHLAKNDYNKDHVMRRLLKIRRVTTFKDLDYHMAVRLFEYNLSSSYIAKTLGIPVSTVINWRSGNSPSSIRDGFVDRALVESKMASVTARISREITEENIDYFMTLKIHEETRKASERPSGRGVGARTISQMLGDHLLRAHLPERTVASWIKGERKPHNLDPRLVDNAFIDGKFRELVIKLTKVHISFHLAKALDMMGWTYTAIALFLGLRKEKLRGWIKKGRGNPVAKTMVDDAYVQRVLRTMLATASGTEDAMDREARSGEVEERPSE
jgi:hypothetical protein